MTDAQNSVLSRGKLGSLIRSLRAEHKLGLGDLTVLAPQNDPYRVDTPAGHRDAAWFVEQFERALGHRDRIHLRGLHYALVARGDVLKPDGSRYINDDANWQWLQNGPAKAARWLGYVPFEKIRDNRNDPPVINRKPAPGMPEIGVTVGLEVDVPSVDEIEPTVWVQGFEARQPYHLVIFGEKSSLSEVILPIAKHFDADVYLPTGEITDTLLYQMAQDGAQDGRPMRVFTLADFDPAGHQMPASIGRKLQALRDLQFPDLKFEVRQVALTVDQVRELGLPSTPLKETERRADRWREAFGVEQTEIDALATLRPDVLRQIVTDALAPFYDSDLSHRTWLAESVWRARAQRQLAAQFDQDVLAELRDQAGAKLGELRDAVQAINDSLHLGLPEGVLLPEVEVPEPEIDASLHGKPLVSSSWDWLDATRALIAHKSYGSSE
jgi:hypothetical protein